MSRQTAAKTELCSKFPAELLLLVQCAHQQPDAEQANRIREAAAARDMDWTSFMRLAERHRVVPHAFLALSRSAADLVPRSAMDALAGRFRANARRNLLAGRELARICRASNAAGIPLMCLKGPALAMQIYGGLQCRQFNDLDLLVPPQSILQAAELLNTLGYREQFASLTSLRPRQRNRLMKYYKHIAFVNPRMPGVVVELHWAIARTGEFPIDAQRLWNDRHQLVLGKGRCYVLPPEEQIVFLAWHGGCHRWKRLSWLFDLAQAIRAAEEFDETTLLQTAAALRVEKYMLLGLALARTLTAGVVPETACRSPRVQRQMELSYRAMLADEMHYEKKPLFGLFWAWHMSPTIRLRPEALFHTFAPREEHIHLSGPLAYLKRLLQLQSRAWQTLLSMLPGLGRWRSLPGNY
jgi:hypothetical protein